VIFISGRVVGMVEPCGSLFVRRRLRDDSGENTRAFRSVAGTGTGGGEIAGKDRYAPG